jgi:hypothetical protein
MEYFISNYKNIKKIDEEIITEEKRKTAEEFYKENNPIYKKITERPMSSKSGIKKSEKSRNDYNLFGDDSNKNSEDDLDEIFMAKTQIDFRIKDKIDIDENKIIKNKNEEEKNEEIINENKGILSLNYYGLVSTSSYQKMIDNIFFNKYFEDSKCEKKINIGEENVTIYICDNDINVKKFPKLLLFNKLLNFTFIFEGKELFRKFSKDKIIFLIHFGQEIDKW